MFCRIGNSLKLQRLGSQQQHLLNALPATTVSARELGFVFKTDGAIYRDFEQLKLLRKQADPNVDKVLEAFHKNYVPSTVDPTYAAISKHMQKLTKDNADDDTQSVSEEFMLDVDDLCKTFKTKGQPYQLYLKENKVAINKKMKDGERFLQAGSRMYNKLNDHQKSQLLQKANNEYSTKYRAVSAKHAKNNMTVPQFLNPYKPADSVVSVADRSLWKSIQKEIKSTETAAKVAGVVAKEQKSDRTANRTALRAQYGFHKNYTNIASGVHLLTVEHLRLADPGVHLPTLLKELSVRKAKMTAAQHSGIEKKSEKLTEEYVATNKAASLKAIEDKAWAALKESEMKLYGTKEEMQAYRRHVNGQRKANVAEIVKVESGKKVANMLEKNMKLEKRKCRASNGFNKDLYFRGHPFNLYLAHNNLSLAQVRKGWESKVSKTEMEALMAESKQLKAEYVKQNKAAAKCAIAAGDWIALNVGEVKEFGSKNDLSEFHKAKKTFEAKMMQQFEV